MKAPFVEFVLRFRELERKNATQTSRSIPGPIIIAHDHERDARAPQLSRLARSAIAGSGR